MWSLAFFIFGFVALVKGSDFLIDGSRSIAKRFKISDWIIGITIVGIGTSIPEFSITLLSALKNEVDIGLGTIIGSNTFNALFILGLVALVYPISAKPRWINQDLTINILAVIITGIFILFPIFGGNFFELSSGEGRLLLILFLMWIFRELSKNGIDKATDKNDPALKIFSVLSSFLMIGGGLAGVLIGAQWVIDGALIIANYLGTSQAVIGLTIVGIGTSLPEITVSLRAARRKDFGISLGNIIGSNIFDFLGILGIAALFGAISVPKELFIDFGVTLGAMLILMAMILSGKKYVLQRWQGGVMVLVYLSYLFFTFQF
ncbi:MAG: hypothetical protein COV31_01070 [Candidatus Yanofskybacteria bacterium CG10_big_fil_rev_8_21_14_0_10_46_23]|uniref:Sodium/calcium exchanger membrane region domain-containing protein n=1 Tax=Candidatus Yanofskybacteria bacterium CG10_big_fil_rev_8_21_14_0_10_46_23 TaxID=1975098 RepID=A0A2H0R4J9_9BACT|nr:MAG: hypothetical protein COV31_01070 [Candidatus Yanofskybacteria bacterium CG10_big_fil_rev_8_21_14_0_10_46_23]